MPVDVQSSSPVSRNIAMVIGVESARVEVVARRQGPGASLVTERPDYIRIPLVRLKWRLSAMKQPAPTHPMGEPPSTVSSVDTATLELLAAWRADDATSDPEQLRKADEEIAEFKRAMNENRAAVGARLLFP